MSDSYAGLSLLAPSSSSSSKSRNILNASKSEFLALPVTVGLTVAGVDEISCTYEAVTVVMALKPRMKIKRANTRVKSVGGGGGLLHPIALAQIGWQ